MSDMAFTRTFTHSEISHTNSFSTTTLSFPSDSFKVQMYLASLIIVEKLVEFVLDNIDTKLLYGLTSIKKVVGGVIHGVYRCFKCFNKSDVNASNLYSLKR